MKNTFVKFTEDHVAGYPKGAVIGTTLKHAQILVSKERAVVVDEKDFIVYSKEAPKKMVEHVEKVKKEAQELIDKEQSKSKK